MRLTRALWGLSLMAVVGLVAIAARPGYAQESSAMKQVGMVRTGAGTFSIDVEGADIRTVVRAIAEFSGRNIVVSPTAKGTVRITLRNVGWQEALRTVLRSNGLDYLEEGNIIRIDEAGKLHAEEVERETARAKAMELVP